VYNRAPAFRQDFLCRIGKNILEVLGLLIVELKRLRAHRLKVCDLLLRLQGELLLGCQFVAWSDPDNVAGLAHVQSLCLENDVQRLVPRHVLQPQRQIPAHRIAGNNVEVGEIGDQLKHRTHFDVLEVQREFLSRIPFAFLRAAGFLNHGLDFYDEALVGLIRRLFPASLGGDGDAGIIALPGDLEEVDLRTEVRDVEAPLERRRQHCLQKVHQYGAPLLSEINPRQQGRTVLVDFLQTMLPPALERRFDVTDFGTQVDFFEVTRQGNNTRITVTPKGRWEQSAYQTDKRFIIEIK